MRVWCRVNDDAVRPAAKKRPAGRNVGEFQFKLDLDTTISRVAHTVGAANLVADYRSLLS
jgi:hypothetical protein